MGCDIHSTAEKKINGKWTLIEGLEPFDWRSYGMYGFLADVRNYSAVPPLSHPRGIPDDAVHANDPWKYGDHSYSWLSVEELTTFDYDEPVEDRRYMGMDPRGFMNGALTAEPGKGEMTTWREFLGESFFEDLESLKKAGAERIVFGFDS